MTINLSKAAKWYKEESHQLAAWNWLESQLSDDQLDEFASMYRAGPGQPHWSDHYSRYHATTNWLSRQ